MTTPLPHPVGEMARLFVAVHPPPVVIDAVLSLPRTDQQGVRWTSPDQWHVTLRFLGMAPVAETWAALASLSAVACTATIGPAVAVLGRAVCLPVTGLEQVAAAVASATATVGNPVDSRPFVGHLTLARLKRTRLCDLVGAALGAEFPVTEVQLMRSELGAEGARHTPVDTVALAPLS